MRYGRIEVHYQRGETGIIGKASYSFVDGDITDLTFTTVAIQVAGDVANAAIADYDKQFTKKQEEETPKVV